MDLESPRADGGGGDYLAITPDSGETLGFEECAERAILASCLSGVGVLVILLGCHHHPKTDRAYADGDGTVVLAAMGGLLLAIGCACWIWLAVRMCCR